MDIFAFVIQNFDKISITVFCVVGIIYMSRYMTKDQAARILKEDAENKARADAHQERMAASALLNNQLVIGNKQVETMENVSAALVKVGESQTALQSTISNQTKDLNTKFKSTLDDGVRIKMGLMQINSIGEVVLVNHDALNLLGLSSPDMIKGHQFQTLGLKMTDTDDNILKDLAALPFGSALTTGILQADKALIKVQRLDLTWSKLLLSMMLIDGDEVKKKQVLLTFIDVGELENLAPGTTASKPQ